MNLSEFNKNKEELSKLNQSFAALNDGFKKLIDKKKEIKGEHTGEKEDEMMEYMHSLFSNVHNRISYAENMIYGCMDDQYKHKSVGHLPVLSASQMKKAMTKMGLDEDFDIRPATTVYASKGRSYLEVEMKKDK